MSDSSWQTTVLDLLLNESDDLRVLAESVGANPQNFYRSANLRKADLRSQNLNGIDLSRANIIDAQLPSGFSKNHETRGKTKRVHVRLNPSIYLLLSLARPYQVSRTVNDMMELFLLSYADHVSPVELRHTSIKDYLRKLEVEILESINHGHMFDEPYDPYTFNVTDNLTERIMAHPLLEKAGVNRSEAVRVSIYSVLRYGGEHGLSAYDLSLDTGVESFYEGG